MGRCTERRGDMVSCGLCLFSPQERKPVPVSELAEAWSTEAVVQA